MTMKKRLIFTLFYAEGFFFQSRNFTIQKVGNVRWLNKNYDFSRVAYAIDELMVLDISRSNRDTGQFIENLQEVGKDCFVPIAAGGGIREVEDARKLLRNGADKVVVNSLFGCDPGVVKRIADEFGRQSIIASVDVKREGGEFYPRTENGERRHPSPLASWVNDILECNVGEIYLNSIDKDGTGQGYQMDMVDSLPNLPSVPLIISGGAGKSAHFVEGLRDDRIDAVATGNLFNFVGNGLIKARDQIIEEGLNVAAWDPAEIEELYMSLGE